MAAILLSSTEFAQQLEQVGMPPAQAKVVADGLAAMYVQHFDALVTKDYLDTRFAQQKAEINQRLAEQTAQFNQRFSEQRAEMDQRFTEQRAEMDQRFTEQRAEFNQRFAELTSDVDRRFTAVNVMLAVILAAVAVPVLQAVLVWAA